MRLSEIENVCCSDACITRSSRSRDRTWTRYRDQVRGTNFGAVVGLWDLTNVESDLNWYHDQLFETFNLNRNHG